VFKTLAWATDGSRSAHDGLALATGLAQTYGAKLAIIVVREVIVGRTAVFVDPDDEAVASMHRTAEELHGTGIETTVLVSRVRAGEAARVIVDRANRAGVDVIVVGNRGHGPLAGFLFGSVAARLLRIASCPVLVAPARPGSDPAPAVRKAARDLDGLRDHRNTP
jgi:nucleotide-binding universal stress UspA family protein